MIHVGYDFSKMSNEEILTKIRGSKQLIGKNKKLLETELYIPQEESTLDAEGVTLAIEMERWSIAEAIRTLVERGYEYTPSKAEQQSNEFQDNLSKLKKITLITTEYMLPHTYELHFEDDVVCVGKETLEGFVELYHLDKNELLADIRELYVGEWNKHYTASDYGIYILDGDSWEMIFEYDDGTAVSFEGENAYPYNFFDLIAVLDPNDILFEE